MPNSIHIVRDRRARRRRAKSGLRSMRPWFVGSILMLFMIVFASATAVAVIVLGVYSEIVVDLPSAESLELAFQDSSNQFFQTTKIILHSRVFSSECGEVYGVCEGVGGREGRGATLP